MLLASIISMLIVFILGFSSKYLELVANFSEYEVNTQLFSQTRLSGRLCSDITFHSPIPTFRQKLYQFL